MGLRRKPHTVTVETPTQVLSAGNILLGHTDTTQGTVRGQLTPSDPGTTYEQYGINTSRPHLFFCDVADASKFVVGGEVTYGARLFSIVSVPRTFAGHGGGDHTSVVLEEKD